MSEPIKPVRRIVTIDNDKGTSLAIEDAPSPDVRTDPARPGFASTRIWVTDASPVRIEKKFRDTLLSPDMIEPPPQGSLCHIVTIPPDASLGAPRASTYAPSAPHPYMQKTATLDFCLILEGEVTLVLDTEEVALRAGDTVVQRGTNHAWSNRSDKPCRIAVSSHDASG